MTETTLLLVQRPSTIRRQENVVHEIFRTVHHLLAPRIAVFAV